MVQPLMHCDPPLHQVKILARGRVVLRVRTLVAGAPCPWKQVPVRGVTVIDDREGRVP